MRTDVLFFEVDFLGSLAVKSIDDTEKNNYLKV